MWIVRCLRYPRFKPKPAHLYYLLAAVNLATLAASLLLGHYLLAGYSQSAHMAHRYLQEQSQCLELMRLAADVGARRNDLLQSHDIVAQRVRVDRAVESYHKTATAIRTSLAQRQAPAVSMAAWLDVTDAHLRSVQDEARYIFAALEIGDTQSVGNRIAVFDRSLAGARESLVALCQSSGHAHQQEVAAEVAGASSLSRAYGGLVVGAAFVVLLVSWYGHRLAQRMATQQRELCQQVNTAADAVSERQHAESEIQRQQAELTRYVADLETARRTLADRTAELNAAQEALQARAEESRQAQQRAEEASRSKCEFLANMSYEIRTPMTAILGYAENLFCPDLSSHDRTLAVQTIRRNGEHLLEIINDILDVAKIEAGKLEIERIPSSIVQILAEVAALMRTRADAKKLAFNIEYLSPVPETIHTDPTRVRQILINLAGNAIKFTQRGSVRIAVRVPDKTAAEPVLQIDVTDTGIGMTKEQTERLFQPFTQSDTSTTRRFGGTGLGLTIAQRLAEMLGGRIAATSQPGKGATFSVTLPIGSPEGVTWLSQPSDAMTQLSSRPDASPQFHAQKLECRVLLAEDGPDNQRLISFLLQKAGAEVTIVDNGHTALELALEAAGQCQPFDLILMDMQMPVMDGYAAASTLRQRGYDGPIVALTAHAMAGDREKCLAAGCDDFATKPIDRAQLLRTVARHTTTPSRTTTTGFGKPVRGA